MEQKICVVCKGTNITKNDDIYICADCGTKYLKKELELQNTNPEKNGEPVSVEKSKFPVKTIIISAVSVVVVSAAILFTMGIFNDGTENLLPIEEPAIETENIEYADKAFLEAMEKAVVERYENVDEKETKDLIEMELEYLEGFENKTYRDPKLAELAKKYIEGNNLQKEFWSKLSMAKEKLHYLGSVARYEVVIALADNYDFLSERPEIIDAFREILLDVLIELELLTDIENQLDFVQEDGYYVATYTNNTVHTYSIKCYFAIKNGVDTEEYRVDCGSIKPNETIKISYPVFYKGYETEFLAVTQ